MNEIILCIFTFDVGFFSLNWWSFTLLWCERKVYFLVTHRLTTWTCNIFYVELSTCFLRVCVFIFRFFVFVSLSIENFCIWKNQTSRFFFFCTGVQWFVWLEKGYWWRFEWRIFCLAAQIVDKHPMGTWQLWQIDSYCRTRQFDAFKSDRCWPEINNESKRTKTLNNTWQWIWFDFTSNMKY